ncbi:MULTISPECIES: pyridoxal-dependent decarboxylase [Acidithrix]|uniref:L-2,4-diaminobutyrate decarboxylase n=1 Tax=Acidithrix ferrooxidans TaxID=1280514 RepID=A0A0D8HHZ0_9ACTN|nr:MULTISPECIES: pyridoxal-dependent decarboxylase [Acidithrix]KJF17469.1 L-2,4-diaminobutyrate decarboxylase [Acidithrix ferrooxidans]CAG4931511.1 unnamed protein product [Acidithrix sp. C25]
MSEISKENFLAYFPGPKGENSQFIKELFGTVLDDYFHWRRNYYPSDPTVISPSEAHDFIDERSDLQERLSEMLGRLRRSFPFYSPRYIAHQQGETTIPALVGSLAGLLYNSNNVTSETGAVTLEYEIDACNRLLGMIGFTPPPDPPRVVTQASLDEYHKMLSFEYAWCHLTSGGTVANIESLWVARAVKYFPLSVRDTAIARALELKVNVIGEDGLVGMRNISEVDPQELLNIEPSESLALISRYLEAIKQKMGSPRGQDGPSDNEIADMAWRFLESDSKYSLANGMARCLVDFPPAIFVSGAAHYSISKALDLLGLGKDCLVPVEMNSTFRLDINDLELKILDATKKGRIPLCVIGIAGTTEEGAIDPVDKIIELRQRMQTKGISFWVHVDAAWGGFFRTLLIKAASERVIDDLNSLVSIASLELLDGEFELLVFEVDEVKPTITDHFVEKVVRLIQALDDLLFGEGDSDVLFLHYSSSALEALAGRELSSVATALDLLLSVVNQLRDGDADSKGTALPPDDLGSCASSEMVSDLSGEIELVLSNFDYERRREAHFHKSVEVAFSDSAIVGAIDAIALADSVTVDPHKMGYVNYPCGAVAFRNDWVRLLVRQKAPYITSVADARILHLPPRHLVETAKPGDRAKVGLIATEAFAPYTLEGSRPSFPATALWLNTELIPLDRLNHGKIVRSSWLAARELFEWLSNLNEALDATGIRRDFEVLTYAREDGKSKPPDTNIIIFGVRAKGDRTLEGMCDLTNRVYKHFSIQAEHGEREYSYSQPFFLSKTTFAQPAYSYPTMRTFIEAAGITDGEASYRRSGVVVLRSTVMNPYLITLAKRRRVEILREFILEFSRVAQMETEKLIQMPLG